MCSYYSSMKKREKYYDDFWKLTLKVKFWNYLKPPHLHQFSKFNDASWIRTNILKTSDENAGNTNPIITKSNSFITNFKASLRKNNVKKKHSHYGYMIVTVAFQPDQPSFLGYAYTRLTIDNFQDFLIA